MIYPPTLIFLSEDLRKVESLLDGSVPIFSLKCKFDLRSKFIDRRELEKVPSDDNLCIDLAKYHDRPLFPPTHLDATEGLRRPLPQNAPDFG